MKLSWSLDTGGIEGACRGSKHTLDPLSVMYKIIKESCEGKIIAIDDCNHIDSGSLHLLSKLISSNPRNIGVIMAIDDPDGDVLSKSPISFFCESHNVTVLSILPLSVPHIKQLIATRAHIPEEAVTSELIKFALQLSSGNCFVLEQLALTLKVGANNAIDMEALKAKWITADSIVLTEIFAGLEKPQKELSLIVALVTESMGHNGAPFEMLQKVSPRKVKKKLKD